MITNFEPPHQSDCRPPGNKCDKLRGLGHPAPLEFSESCFSKGVAQIFVDIHTLGYFTVRGGLNARARWACSPKYALNRREFLCAFLDHGEIEISNNLVENAIPPLWLAGRTSCSATPRPALMPALRSSPCWRPPRLMG